MYLKYKYKVNIKQMYLKYRKKYINKSRTKQLNFSQNARQKQWQPVQVLLIYTPSRIIV